MSTALCICDTFMDTNILMGPPTQLRVKNTKNSIELTDAALDHILSTNKRPDHIILGTCGPQSPELEYIISKYEVIHINHFENHINRLGDIAHLFGLEMMKIFFFYFNRQDFAQIPLLDNKLFPIWISY